MIRLSSMAVLAAGLTLSGCAVLKSPDPIQTYRFGGTPAFASPAQAQPQCQQKTVSMRRLDFDQAARADRLLTVTGMETAYIGGARWIVSASDLFESALSDGFATGAPCLKVTQGLTRDGLSLAVEVRRFETVYEAPGAVPNVRVSISARLLRPGDRSVVAEERIEVLESAGSNRIASIVQAYELATADAVRQIVEWTVVEAEKAPAA